MRASHRWDAGRFERVVTPLLREGMCWIDTQGPETQYWFPSCFRA
jgi:hypothetical protein